MKITFVVSYPFIIIGFILSAPFDIVMECKIGSVCVLNFHYTANDPILQGIV